MSPDSPNPEAATLTALGLEKPTAGAPRATALPAVRETQDTAALTWLALSDLQPVPDAIWQGIQSRLQFDDREKPGQARRHRPFLAWSGWAAAALLAVGWWMESRPVAGKITPDSATAPLLAKISPPPPAAQATPDKTSTNAESALRTELTTLRARLASAANTPPDAPGLLRPAILELRAPGLQDSASSPAESTARLQEIVTRALRRDLLLRQARDPSTLILEHGWPQADWLAHVSGQTIRHLSFPADQWEELGLWKAPDRFYDPATSLVWNPAPDGLGYLGRVSPEAPDPAGFEMPQKKQNPAEPKRLQEAAPSPSPPPASGPSAAPAGYLVSEPGTPDATLILTDLPAPPEGTEQYVIATAADGTTQRYLLAGNVLESPSPQNGSFSGGGSGAVNFSMGNGGMTVSSGLSGDMITLSSLFLTGNYTGFSVIQTQADGSGPTVILSGGHP